MVQRVQRSNAAWLGGGLRVRPLEDGRTEVAAFLKGYLTQQAGMWVSECPPLDLATCGRTKAEALVNTKDAIEAFFESCIARGTLRAALKNLGWNLESDPDVIRVLEDLLDSAGGIRLETHFGPLKVNGDRWESDGVLAIAC